MGSVVPRLSGFGLAGSSAAQDVCMLSPTGWWLAVAPIDLRCGIDRLLVTVSETLGPADRRQRVRVPKSRRITYPYQSAVRGCAGRLALRSQIA